MLAKKRSKKTASAKVKTGTKKTAAKKTPAGKKITVRKVSPGRIAQIRHFDFKVSKPFRFDAAKIKVDVLKRLKSSPTDLDITLEPQEGGYLVYHPTPGFTSAEAPLAQLSVLAIIYNKGTKTVDLDKVVIEYKKAGQTIKKEVFLPLDQLIIDPWFAWAWQNSRPYHENGDVVFLEAPFPDKATLSFYFKNYRAPVSITKSLKPYSQALSPPFKSSDFGKDEYLTGYSMHGGATRYLRMMSVRRHMRVMHGETCFRGKTGRTIRITEFGASQFVQWLTETFCILRTIFQTTGSPMVLMKE